MGGGRRDDAISRGRNEALCGAVLALTGGKGRVFRPRGGGRTVALAGGWPVTCFERRSAAWLDRCVSAAVLAAFGCIARTKKVAFAALHSVC